MFAHSYSYMRPIQQLLSDSDVFSDGSIKRTGTWCISGTVMNYSSPFRHFIQILIPDQTYCALANSSSVISFIF